MGILVVDDSEDWRDLTEAALVGAGYRDVRTAYSAVDAYKVLGLTMPNADAPYSADLVVLDLMMPEIDGIEACARIRNDSRYLDVPIIMVTAANDMDSLSSAFVAGATDYITKPFNQVELLVRVRSALKLKAELDRRRLRENELSNLARPRPANGEKSQWIDDATGLFVGEAAEAYLSASVSRENGESISILVLAVDRLDALQATHGESAKRNTLTCVAQAVRRITAPIGVNAAAYPDGMIVIVAPHVGLRLAKALAHTLCMAVAELSFGSSEANAIDGVTASVGVLTGRTGREENRAELVARARSIVKDAATAGGNRVVAVDISSHS